MVDHTLRDSEAYVFSRQSAVADASRVVMSYLSYSCRLERLTETGFVRIEHGSSESYSTVAAGLLWLS